MSVLILQNTTALCTRTLDGLFRAAIDGWSVGRLDVRVRYSRGADFSGACYYAGQRIFINLGRHLAFPYRLTTHLAPARRAGGVWFRRVIELSLGDGHQLVAFIFAHELFHLLVKRAGRNPRQKEGMCDRFAARFVNERFGIEARMPDGALVPREEWDFQDLERFVSRARDRSPPVVAATSPRSRPGVAGGDGQYRLFAE